MKILLDECVPKTLKFNLSADGHECTTVPEPGPAGKTNGELLILAEGKFEVFVTLDKGVPFQQNPSGCKIGILVIRARSSRVTDILPLIPDCLAALRFIKPGQVAEIGAKTEEGDG
jgi:predicted nuclease of predicted toxin-antitoxin system